MRNEICGGKSFFYFIFFVLHFLRCLGDSQGPNVRRIMKTESKHSGE